jgi:hypothetical protein
MIGVNQFVSIGDTPASVLPLSPSARYGEQHGDSCAQGFGAPARRHDHPDPAAERLSSQRVPDLCAQSARFRLHPAVAVIGSRQAGRAPELGAGAVG